MVSWQWQEVVAACPFRPQGAKFQRAPGLAATPLPVTRQPDLAGVQLLFFASISSGSLLPGFYREECWWEGQGWGHLDPGLCPSNLYGPPAWEPGQAVCRNGGSRVSWEPQNPHLFVGRGSMSAPFGGDNLLPLSCAPGLWLLCS